MISRRYLMGASAAALGAFGLSLDDREASGRAVPPPRSASEATLRELLARNRAMHPIYGGGLANHLSMELFALAALGATPERLREFASAYSKNLCPLPPASMSVDATNWRTALGHSEALAAFAAYFSADLRARGREVALRDALTTLAPSLSSELFHCLIRTAYGAQFDDDEEIAHGLAYWAIKPFSLGAPAATAGTERDFGALLARVRETPSLARAQLSGNSNPARMQQASRLEGFAAVADSLAVGDDTLGRLAGSVRALYASTRDFTALHAVTSTHALRILLPYFPDRELALRHHARALIAAYIRIGAPAIAASSSEQAPQWAEITTKALASNDDHDAKFVFSCHDEEHAHGGELHRRAAALRVGLA